ncbi:type I-F CRISPR-associated protein Csy3 [Pusillimonas sp. CC-YST705]|uniref:Type I-F CRISPR-associated protein Csy3 n=1 Tax=Mesopusillimonas faecipullorum TaxID=2755040 RepID=A0ABS8C9G8_9BURK|nr:type I-F CRISPR-associated protein Csy3 [Mesopusillimonas faecipullorum]MCB5362677.1 type I-F CRISPR-associated protein Csy3 [Mesopusillimonas faecipullorum]
MTANIKLKTASVLAFERKLDPSDALFHGGSWNERNDSAGWQAIGITPKSVRGTISNRLKTKDQDPAKLDAAIQNPNLQTVDVAALPSNADTLRVRFTLRVLAGTGKPSACNDADYQEALQNTVNGYVQEYGFGELALRYATNLANGRFLWRNRIGAEQIEVHISRLQEGEAVQQWTFDALQLSLRGFQKPNSALEELGAVIASGLAGNDHVLLEVTAFARIGAGQEVFPSQELILDRSRGDKSKTLYAVNTVAGMHSQKVGNALRTIDTWFPEGETQGPIAVEPYGSVTTQGKAWRQPKDKVDFYTLLDNWVLKGKAPTNPDDKHFVMAVLIRGGVFGEAN